MTEKEKEIRAHKEYRWMLITIMFPVFMLEENVFRSFRVILN